MIIEAVPPGGDRALHFVRLKPAISPNVGASGAKFLVGGDCVRASPILRNINKDSTLYLCVSEGPYLFMDIL